MTKNQVTSEATISRPKHILSASQFDRPLLDYIVKLTNKIRQFDKSKEGLLYLESLLAHRRVMLYFTQPSTRTFLSFQSASQILGMKSSEIRDASTSSERKGETIEDSLRTFSSYVDIIVMRSPIRGLCDRTAKILDGTKRPVPIINAGSGPDEHPTQALLDIYTLERSFKDLGGIEGKTICMVGDLKRGRTVRSLSRLLTLYPKTKMIFSSPDHFRIEEDLRDVLKSKKVDFLETSDFKEAIANSDAIYMTRIQDEYDVKGESTANLDYSKFCLRADHLPLLKSHCVIMHPLPRRNELDIAIDDDPRAKYWRQERNGMWTRVALMTILMGVDHNIILPEL
jgi:aspartate carbamoyltransferase catalytic subunit